MKKSASNVETIPVPERNEKACGCHQAWIWALFVLLILVSALFVSRRFCGKSCMLGGESLTDFLRVEHRSQRCFFDEKAGLREEKIPSTPFSSKHNLVRIGRVGGAAGKLQGLVVCDSLKEKGKHLDLTWSSGDFNVFLREEDLDLSDPKKAEDFIRWYYEEISPYNQGDNRMLKSPDEFMQRVHFKDMVKRPGAVSRFRRQYAAIGKPVFETQSDRYAMSFYGAEGWTLVKREFQFSKKGILYLSNRWVQEPRWGNWSAF
jgi:hypothetical protein